MNTNYEAGKTYTSEGFVTIPIEKYDDLISTLTEFEIFIDLALRTAELSYTGEDLYFDDDCIRTFIKSVDEAEYNARLGELKYRKNIAKSESETLAENNVGFAVTKEVAEDE